MITLCRPQDDRIDATPAITIDLEREARLSAEFSDRNTCLLIAIDDCVAIGPLETIRASLTQRILRYHIIECIDVLCEAAGTEVCR